MLLSDYPNHCWNPQGASGPWKVPQPGRQTSTEPGSENKMDFRQESPSLMTRLCSSRSSVFPRGKTLLWLSSSRRCRFWQSFRLSLRSTVEGISIAQCLVSFHVLITSTCSIPVQHYTKGHLEWTKLKLRPKSKGKYRIPLFCTTSGLLQNAP